MLRKIGQPREIDASLIEIGDDISAEYKKDNGITMTLRGIVGKRIDLGKSRHLMTSEGATIVSWEPKNPRAIKVILYGREEPEQSTIFDLPAMSKIRDRAS